MDWKKYYLLLKENIYKSKSDSGYSEIISKSLIYFFLRIFALVFSYLFAIITTRKYGESTFGFVTLAFSILMIVSVICRLGFDINLTKTFARNNGNHQIGLYSKSLIVTIIISLFFSVGLYFNAEYISVEIFHKFDFIPYLQWISFAIPLWSIILINTSIFRGLKKTLLYSIFNSFGRFFLTTIILLISIYIVKYDFSFNPIIAHFFGLTILCLVSFFFIKRLLGKINFVSQTPFKSFYKSSVPMFLSTSLIILLAWVDKLYLGYFISEESVGMYDISIRLAALIGFTLEALNSILTPKISEAYSNNDFQRMQREITFSAKINFFLSIFIFLILVIFSKQFLQIFSSKFVEGRTVLLICCIGQLINAFSGPVGNILQMTGRQNLFTKIIGMAFLINLILNPILISNYNIEGAAVALVISMIFWNFTSCYYVYKELGIISFYIPGIKIKK